MIPKKGNCDVEERKIKHRFHSYLACMFGHNSCIGTVQHTPSNCLFVCGDRKDGWMDRWCWVGLTAATPQGYPRHGGVLDNWPAIRKPQKGKWETYCRTERTMRSMKNPRTLFSILHRLIILGRSGGASVPPPPHFDEATVLS